MSVATSFLKVLVEKIIVLLLNQFKNIKIMAKGLNTKKTAKKEPTKTAKEKKEEKREKKNSPKRD